MEALHHDFIPYLRSLTQELRATKDRVRQLVKHWPTDGHFKEEVLRQFLRRHLPESVLVGTGFVVNAFGPSGEIDVLIVDRHMPTLFKDGDLLIVTPEAVRAVIEVKTKLNSPSEIKEAIDGIAQRKAVVTRHVSERHVWAGLFVYEGEDDRHKAILEGVREAKGKFGTIVDCVCYGEDTIVKYFGVNAAEGGRWPHDSWHSFHAVAVAPSNFVASLIEHIVKDDRGFGGFAWMRPPEEFECRYIVKTDHDWEVVAYDEWRKANPSPPFKFPTE